MTPSTTSYRFGDVVLVGFPFTNLQNKKKRPAVIISSMAYSKHRPDVIVLAITSQVHAELTYGEYRIEGWERAGLLKLSVFKPLIATLDKALILRKLGRLGKRDIATLDDLLRDMLGKRIV